MRRAPFLLLAAAALALWAAPAAARDVVLVDAKMGWYDRNNDHAWVTPCPNGDCWSSYLGQRDSSGWIVYDTLVRVIMTYQLEDFDTIEVHDIDWVEWALKVKLQSEMDFQDSETIWISIGAKINQASGASGPEEARRWWTVDWFDDYWPFVTHVFNVPFNQPDYVLHNRPYYTNPGFIHFMQFVPDTNLQIGYNPSHFRYFIVHASAVPFDHDTLHVSTQWYPDCSRIFWTPEDGSDPDLPQLPVYPAIDCVPQDPDTPGLYHIDEAALGLPSGQYDIQARVAATIGRPSYTFTAAQNVNLDGSGRSTYDLTLTGEQLGQNPQVLEFTQGQGPSFHIVKRVPLGYLEEQWPAAAANIVPIPRRAN